MRKEVLLGLLQGNTKRESKPESGDHPPRASHPEDQTINLEAQAGKLWHPFLLPLRWTIETAENFFLIYDSVWNEAGILLSRHLHGLLEEESPPLPPILPINQIRFISAEIILALEHLHSLSFVYGNLSPETVMIDLQGPNLLPPPSQLCSGVILITIIGHVRLTGFSFQRPYDTTSSDVYNTAYICMLSYICHLATQFFFLLSSKQHPKLFVAMVMENAAIGGVWAILFTN